MRGEVEQSAGLVSIRVSLGGAPLWPMLKITSVNTDTHEVMLSIGDLHDLRYCIDRVLAQVSGDLK